MIDTGWRRMIGRTALLLLMMLHFATGGMCAKKPMIYALQSGETLIFFMSTESYTDGEVINKTFNGTGTFEGKVYSAEGTGWEAGTVKKVILQEKIAPDDIS